MTADYFDRRAATYHRDAERGAWAWQRTREARAVLALAGSPAGRSVLDLGCGAGYYARLAAARGASAVTAVDRSAAMAAQVPPPVEAVVADAARVRLGRRFDIVLALGLLEFVDDPAAVTANAAAHLATGGRLIVLVPPDNLAGHLYRLFHNGHGLAVRLFSPPSVEEMARSCGLTVSGRRMVAPYSAVYAMEPGCPRACCS